MDDATKMSAPREGALSDARTKSYALFVRGWLCLEVNGTRLGKMKPVDGWCSEGTAESHGSALDACEVTQTAAQHHDRGLSEEHGRPPSNTRRVCTRPG
jgi:hypothetical protein